MMHTKKSLINTVPILRILPLLSLYIYLLEIVNTQSWFLLCPKFFCSSSVRDAKDDKIRTLYN